MGTHILTLFGEEIIPEQKPAPAKKKSAPKKKKAPKEPVPVEEAAEEPAEQVKEITATEPAEPKKDILEDWKGDKKYYTIGEVAKLFKVRTSNIRYWTKEFAMKVRTTRKGDRLYTPEQVKEVRTIYHLVKERGFTISGAKAKLKENKKISVETVDLKDSLLQLRHKLVDLKNSLK